MAVAIHNDFDKLKTLIKIIDESFEYGNNAADNVWDMLDDAQAELANTLSSDNALIYTNSLSEIHDVFTGSLETMLGSLDTWNTIYLMDAKPEPSSDTILQAIVKALAYSRIIEGVTTLTNGNTAIAGVGTAYEDEIAAGDYLYREDDGVAFATEIASITNDTTATFVAGGYLGTTGTGNIIIQRTIPSRNVTKTLTYSPSTAGNKMKVFHIDTDRYGFDRETFRNEGKWRLGVTRLRDYSGNIKLSFKESVLDQGERTSLLSPYGARENTEVIIPIVNPYTVTTIYSNSEAGKMAYSDGTGDSLESYGWYSADWTNAAISDTIFKHAKPGTKKPSVWTEGGTGSSLQVTGNLTMTILIDKTILSSWIPYKILVDYIFDAFDDDIDMKLTIGGVTTTFGITDVLTGTSDFINTNTTVTGTGTAYLSELSPGDLIRATAHAAAVATEIASIESNTSLTLVAGGYLGATTGGAVGSTRHNTAWHTGELDLGYPDNFISDEDAELEVDFDFTGGQINVDNISPVPLTVIPQLATALIFWGGEVDVDLDDYWEWDIALVGADSPLQRWYVEKFGVGLPHRSTRPTFSNPA